MNTYIPMIFKKHCSDGCGYGSVQYIANQAETLPGINGIGEGIRFEGKIYARTYKERHCTSAASVGNENDRIMTETEGNVLLLIQ